MILSTTATLQGREIDRYLGVVFGDTVVGVNVLKDLMGSIRDFVGGRSGTYERELGTARDAALQELLAQANSLGADAVIGTTAWERNFRGPSRPAGSSAQRTRLRQR